MEERHPPSPIGLVPLSSHDDRRPRFYELSLLANHFPSLHGLRVLGILSVIQIHLGFELASRGFISRQSLLWQTTQRLWFGMDLFFFLSGLLIGGILLADGARRESVGKFYLRRSFRIIPLYYVVLTALAVTTPLTAGQRENLWREYLYLTNYTDVSKVVMVWAWSLCVEEHFYLFVPLLMAFVRWVPHHGAKIAVLVSLWASGALVRFAIYVLVAKAAGPLGHFRLLYIPTHARYDILMAGVLMAYLLKTEGDRLRRWMGGTAVRVGVAMAAAALFATLIIGPTGSTVDAFGLLAIGTITGPAYFALVLYLVTGNGLASRVLGSSFFRRLATLGYGVYLVHMPLVIGAGIGGFVLLTRFGLPPMPGFLGALALVFALSLFVAYFLHLLVEKPALFVRDKVSKASPS